MAPFSRVVSRSHSIEPLESRIAPALLINGANLLVAGSGTSVGESSVGDNNVELVKVTSGSAIVWYDNGIITAISFAPNTSLEIVGSVGTLIGNLQSNGRLSDTNNNPADGEDGEVLLPNNLLGLKVRPFSGIEAVVGSIITGGSVRNVTIDGQISGIYAGDGVFQEGDGVDQNGSALLDGGVVRVNVGLDYNPITAGVDDSFDLTLAAAIAPQQPGLQPGASVKNVKINKAASLQIFAGNGDPDNSAAGTKKGVAGGSITNVFIETAFTSGDGSTPSYELRAGDGASAKKGGGGGGISKIVEKSSGGDVVITAGAGGTGSEGAGGAGGWVTDLDIQSDSSQYNVTAGAGGNGTPGGAGGTVQSASFANRTPVGGVILAADFTGDGKDDILVADQGSGQMVVYENIDDGANFVLIEQYRNDSNEPQYKIDPLDGGATPVDAVAVDFDGDGDLDVVVAYKNSNSVGVFFNQSDLEAKENLGTFWDPTLNDEAGGFSGFTVGVQLSPSKLAALDGGGNRIAVAGVTDGKGAVQLLRRTVDGGDFSLQLADGINTFKAIISDIVPSSNGSLFMATGDGRIQQLAISNLDDKTPFSVTDTTVRISGGIDDLDLDSTGTRLLALSTVGKTMTVFSINAAIGDGLLTDPIVIDLSGSAGKPLVANFVRDSGFSPDRIAVLNSVSAGARMDLFNPISAPGSDLVTSYTFARSLSTEQTLNRFVPAYSDTGSAGFAALGGSLTDFTFGDDFLQLKDYTIPFDAKFVKVTAGDGGLGIDLVDKKKIGKGGAGGNVIGLNAIANEVEATAGAGGNSQTGAGGAGGSIIGKATITTVSGTKLIPTLISDTKINLQAGRGGSATMEPTNGKKLTASGGAGGMISNLNLQLSAGQSIDLTAGSGGSSQGGAAGSGGGISSITSKASGGTLNITAGTGGNALVSGPGGAGGAVKGINHTSELLDEAELIEMSLGVTILAGEGGTSIDAAGGNGGSVSEVTLKLDSPNTTAVFGSPIPDANKPSNVHTRIVAGTGGIGAKGGLGGSVSGLRYDAVLDQLYKNRVIDNFFTLSVTAGAGGEGTKTNGGNGGSILLKAPISGVSFFDKPADEPYPADNPDGIALVLTAGAGGKGAVKGGNGGGISGLIAQNTPFFDGSVVRTTQLETAKLTAGDGGEGGSGNGGTGGSVTGALVGVQFGLLQVTAGVGGNSLQAKGGAGGSLANSEFGLVSTFSNAGMMLVAGNGGNGIDGGGAGGAVSNLKINTSQSTDTLSAFIIAGAGGDANSARGSAGVGGSIKGISQAKDVNSSINLIQAGNGGDNPLGKAGKGGSVSDVRTVGFIGRPSDGDTALGVFDTLVYNSDIEILGVVILIPDVEIPTGLFDDNGNGSATFAQGLFAGRGGVGQSGNAATGSVSNVAARQIAAIAAAMDPTTRLFDSVAKITNLRADLVGYDSDGDGVFDDSLGGMESPETTIPTDGFILSAIALSESKGIAKNLVTDDRKSFWSFA